MDVKKILGEYAASFIKEGMVVGLGTGTTSEAFVNALAERIHREDITIKGVPTSVRTENLAKKLGIPLTNLEKIDVAFDGADEVDRGKNLLKGGGGAMLREKIVDYAAHEFFCLVEKRKLVDKFSWPVPCEILPFALPYARTCLAKLGDPILRTSRENPFITDNGNFIVDLKAEVGDPKKMEMELNQVPGVLGNGIFTCPSRIIMADEFGNISEL